MLELIFLIIEIVKRGLLMGYISSNKRWMYMKEVMVEEVLEMEIYLRIFRKLISLI
jgi:hypothetical protein